MGFIDVVMAPLVVTVTSVLFHAVWQGALIAAVSAVVLSMLQLLRRNSAVLRYRLLCLALLSMVVAPVMTAVTTGSIVPLVPLETGFGALPTPSTSSGPGAGAAGQAVDPAGSATSTTAVSTAAAWLRTLPLNAVRQWVFLFWLAGVLLGSTVHVVGWRRVVRLRRVHTSRVPVAWDEMAAQLSGRLGITRTVRVLASLCVEVPTVIGWLSPVVLIPAGAVAGMSAEDLRSILSHELAHIRRRDYLVNLLQVVAETLLFFHPAVWWISRQIRMEREHCCDDLAVELTGSRIAVARALVRLEENRLTQAHLAMRADGGSLVSRIRRLTGGNTMPDSTTSRPRLTGAIISALLIAGSALVLTIATETPGTAIAGPAASQQQESDAYSSNEDRFAETGRWELDHEDGELYIRLRKGRRHERWSISTTVERRDLIGLSDGDTEFELRRDAGTIFFTGEVEGQGDDLVGDGRFGFVPNDEFKKELKRIGVSDVDDDHMLMFATEGIDKEYIRGLEKLGYDSVGEKRLFEMAIHGVSIDFLNGMHKRGHTELRLRQAVKMRIHGVTLEYLDEMADLGFDDASSEDLVKWRIHGVSPEFVGDVGDLGFDHVSSRDLVKMRIHGVSPEFVETMRKMGYEDLSIDDFMKWRIHGVTTDFIESMEKLGYEDIPPRSLIQMRIHGVSPGFVKRLHKKGLDHISIQQLIKMKIHGIDLE